MSQENNLLLAVDILQPLPTNKWPLLEDALRRDWPRFAYYHYWIRNAIDWRRKEPGIKLDVLCPEGNHDKGVFIGVSSYSMYMLIPFAFRESRSLLFDCIARTRRIDWKEPVIFAAVHEYFEDAVRNAIESMGLRVDDNGPSNYYFKPKEQCLDEDIRVSEGLELRFLGESDVPVVHEHWPREEVKKEPNKSTAYVATMVKLSRGVGLFDKADGKLVAWALQNEFGGLGNVQTVDECRGRGYAKVVVKALSKLLAEEGRDSTLFIVAGNSKSEGLFASLGYELINAETFIVMKPLNAGK
ncbi:uncharacterized protein LOC106641215 [Copidosoma floridanum]|uniref:uncharacterized protein LOC106641215 n=1 Tax=Copidosoma floridanum TaxID=29053 RepID=UPI0006C986C1|nr:uncharacterized protein LOC106641215 [Copidosoma floridanum]